MRGFFCTPNSVHKNKGNIYESKTHDHNKKRF